MYLHCIRSLHFLKAVSNSFLDSARLHLLHILGCFPYVFALYTFVTLFRGFLIFFFQHTDLVYICYILWDVFPIYFHCIRSLHFLRAVSNSFLDSARLHLLHILGWFPYVFALYTLVTLFRGFLIFFFQHTDLVYICYILWDVFPIYFHCIRSLHFLRAVSNSFLDSARLHPLHILGWFPYVFALYTFVTLFRGFLIFFFSTYRSCIPYLPYIFGRIKIIIFFTVRTFNLEKNYNCFSVRIFMNAEKLPIIEGIHRYICGNFNVYTDRCENEQFV